MPANKGGESKQGLIITLVGFILLSIILGVTTYYGYAEQAALKTAADTAKKDADTAKKDRDWYKFVALQLKSYAGYLTKQEEGDLPVMRESYRGGSLSGEDKAAYDNVFRELDERLVKDARKDRTLEPFRERVARLEEELRTTRASLQNEKNNLAKERAEHAKLMDVRDDELKEARANLAKAEQTNVDEQKKMSEALVSRLQEFGDQSVELEKIKKKAATDVGTLEKEQKRLKEEVKDQQAAREKLAQKMTPPDLQKFSTPKGKIVNIDARAQMAWVNLGSADHVRSQQGLTFSIFGQGPGGRSNTVYKGALEVVDVLEPHLSRARITATADPRTNPIQTGDLLVNPLWSPTMPGHVAIAGLIDFTGDGRDQFDQLRRALEKQNVIIDAYLDLRDATIKGKMTLNTDFLILGEQPEVNSNIPIREGDARFERKTELMSKISEMQLEAERLGVPKVSLRRFADLTGYQMPRGARSTSGFSYESRVPSSSSGAAKDGGKNGKASEPKNDDK